MILRRAVALLACAGVCVAVGVGPAGASSAPLRRLLIFSVPHVEWDDVSPRTTPNLWRLLERSAVGGLITPGIRRPTTLGDAYLSLGAGARITGEPQDLVIGDGREVDEPYGTTTAGDAFALRTGRALDGGLVYLPVVNVERSFATLHYDGRIGTLGQTLRDAGVATAVIANGDASPVAAAPLVPAQRAAVAALMNRRGVVPAGAVGPELLEGDASTPSGTSLDARAVVDAFDASWHGRAAVLVEGSDLVRAENATANRSAGAQRTARVEALRSTDDLLGVLLQHVDPTRDGVLVVAPAPPRVAPGLTLVGLRAPGVAPGELRSATTRRDGLVNIVDVAPTVLDRFGILSPRSIEGNAMERADGGSSLAARQASFVRLSDDGRFRDGQVGIAQGVLVLAALVLAVAAFACWRSHGRYGRGVVWLARWIVGFLTATYLAAPLHFAAHGGWLAYWTFLVVVGALVALAIERVATWTGIEEVLVAGASVVLLHALDLLTGAPLELNSVFGYSPTVGIRVAGEGNLTFGQLIAATIVVSALLVARWPGRRGISAAGLLTFVVFVIMGAPLWGQDFGAVLVGAPVFTMLLWLVAGRRIRPRHVAVLAAVLVASGVAVGVLDMLRPADERTHVGRFFDKLFHDPGAALEVVQRKAGSSLGSVTGSILLFAVPIVVLLLVWWWLVPDSPLRRLVQRVATARAAALTLAIAAVLGFALNDSGVAIPAMMLVVLESFVVVAVVEPA